MKNSGIRFSNDNSSPKMLLEDSSFLNCSNSEHGGSLYYNATGECVQSRVCYYRSFLSNNSGEINGISCYVFTKKDPSMKNYMLQTSFFSCGSENYNGVFNAWLAYGETICKDWNSTHNRAKYRAVIQFDIISNASIKYTYSCNNNQTNNQLIRVNALDQKVNTLFMYGDVINNKLYDSKYNNVFSIRCTGLVDHCCFLNNTPTSMFGCDPTYVVTVNNSFFDSATLYNAYPCGTYLFFNNITIPFDNDLVSVNKYPCIQHYAPPSDITRECCDCETAVFIAAIYCD